MKDLQNYVDNFGFGIGVEKLVTGAYFAMRAAGHECCVCNGRYLEVDGVYYRFTKSQKLHRWIVKEF